MPGARHISAAKCPNQAVEPGPGAAHWNLSRATVKRKMRSAIVRPKVVERIVRRKFDTAHAADIVRSVVRGAVTHQELRFAAALER